MTKQEKLKQAKEVTEKLNKLNSMQKTEDLIKDNKIEFKIGDKQYRVSKPNFFQREENRKARAKKYRELLEEDVYLPRKVIKEKLKENKGMDIGKLENKIRDYNNDIEKLQVKLAPSKDKKTRERLSKKIIELQVKVRALEIEISEWLDPCLELELTNYSNMYLVYLVLEEKTGKKYKRAFKSFKDMQENASQKLISEASYYLGVLIYDNEEL